MILPLLAAKCPPMLSTMANNSIKKVLKAVISAAFWILIWEAASLLVPDDLKLFLPGPLSVIKTFFKILPSSHFLKAVGATLLRIFSGLLIGSLLGMVLGVFTGESKIFDTLLSPALKIIRAVPVVSFIILAFLFIKVNRLPVFISSLMVTPLVWQAVNDSVKNADKNLIDMSRVFKLSKFKSLFYVKLYSGFDRIITALLSAVGLAWKSGVAAEVLCTPAVSIGKNIYKAKGNLNFDEVYALTITVVILSLIFEYLIKAAWKKYGKAEENKND